MFKNARRLGSKKRERERERARALIIWQAARALLDYLAGLPDTECLIGMCTWPLPGPAKLINCCRFDALSLPLTFDVLASYHFFHIVQAWKSRCCMCPSCTLEHRMWPNDLMSGTRYSIFAQFLSANDATIRNQHEQYGLGVGSRPLFAFLATQGHALRRPTSGPDAIPFALQGEAPDRSPCEIGLP